MRRKKMQVKLILNKETIANVSRKEMPKIKGGGATEPDFCTEYPEYCPKTIAETRFWTCYC
jgi:hypothetical protein